MNKLESPSAKDTLCQVLLNLAQLFWRRKFEKSTYADRRQTTGYQKSSLELSAQVSNKHKTNIHSFINCNIRYRYMLLQSTKHVYTGFKASQIVFNIFSRQRKKITSYFTEWKSSDHILDHRTK